MRNLPSFESFLNENIRPDQIEKVSKDLAYSMPNHTEPDSKGKFSAEQVQKAFKYIPDLKYVKDKNDIQTIIDKVLAIVNESVNEGESLIYDEIGEDLVKLQDQIDSMLKWKITDPKWIIALKGIQSACSKLDDIIAKADDKLGAIPYNESIVNEGKKYEIKDFPVDSLVTFNDGEIWKVVKPSGMSGLFSRRRGSDEISIKPFNKLAKDRNVSLPIDASLDFLNKNITKIVTESVNESISDIDILAQESKDFKDFVKNFKKEYADIASAGTEKELMVFLKSIFDNSSRD